MNEKYDAFISYAHPDRKFAIELAARLSDSGFKVFFDEAELAVGESFAASLVDAVKSARATLVLMSPEYFASDWSRSELEVSAAAELEKGTKTGGRILPLLIRDCHIPPLLRARAYADCRTKESYDASLPLIVDSLKALSSDASGSGGITHTGSGAITQGKGAMAAGGRSVAVSGDAVGTIIKGTSHVVNLGQIFSPFATQELKTQLEELKKRVDAFGGPPSKRSAPATRPESIPKKCFVAMPFSSSELNDIYEYFVKPSLESGCDLHCERGDDVFGSNVIMEDIRYAIASCRVVIADLTGRNPNVFYEVGIAHTLDKEVLLLSQSMEDVPFDLRHRRVLVYENTPRGCKLLEKRVVENINAMLSK